MKVPGALLLALVIVQAGQLVAQAQPYPAHPVRLIVPSSPGGGSDLTARLIAPRLGEHLHQQIVIDNRPGAGTAIGAELVARAAPDGYTLLLGSTALVTTAAMHRKLPFDTLRDFAPITQYVAMPNLLVAHPSLPVTSVKELIAFARSRPGQLTFASAGVGSNPQLTMELFLSMTGLKMVHVPYKGAGPGVVDVIAGNVPLMTPSIISVLAYVRSGRLRALGVTGPSRASGAPEIPTVAEAGVPGYDSAQWFGVLAPAGTPREIVMQLHSGIVRALQQPDLKGRLLSDGAEPVGSSPEEFAGHIRSETAKWAKVVKGRRDSGGIGSAKGVDESAKTSKGESAMDIKPTLQVIDAAKIKSRPGVTKGQTLQPIVGHDERPTDRVRTALATYEPGTVEQLHWHPIEAYYFVISGRAIVRDFQGNEYEAGPGTSIYAPAGIAGAHEWEIMEPTQLLSVRASTDPARKMQFTVDKKTKRSFIELDELARRGGVSFKSHY